MNFRRIVCLIQVFLLLCPLSQAWGQPLEEQARYYLQQIGPTAPSIKPVTPRLPSPEMPRAENNQATPPQVITAAPRQPEEVSAVELRAWEQYMFIRQFGYSFFYQPPATFLPVQEVPVGPDYIIGPGDSLRVMLWGSVQGEYRLQVDRSGQVAIPKVGVVQVSGLTYRQLREVLDKEFSRQYTNFQMNVTLDNLRTLQVFVVGQARFPGSYAVSSLSTLISALFAAGGPSKSGSLRQIQVRRGGKVIVNFDMYDFLIHGDKSKDIRLQSEDVIFIPPVGTLVAIGYPKTPDEIAEDLRLMARLELEEGSPGNQAAMNWRQREAQAIISEVKPREPEKGWLARQAGEKEYYFEQRFKMSLKEAGQKIATSKQMEKGGPIKVPGIYELRGERTLTDLLRMAGGLGGTAFKGRVQVLRVKDRQEMVLFEDDLARIMKWGSKDVSLVDGDFVKIFGVSGIVEKKVAISGAVKNPGEYGFKENMSVKDLLSLSGGLLVQANKEEAEITRVTITREGPQTSRIYVNLDRALADNTRDNLRLHPNDYLLVRPIPDWDIYKTVRMDGEVRYPGSYSIKKGETLSSLLGRAGGFLDKAYLKGAVLTRVSVKAVQKEQLSKAIDRAEAAVLAKAGERTMAGLEAEEARRTEVMAKQQLQLLATLKKVEPLGRVIIRLDDPERLRGTPGDLELQNGDSLFIPPVPQTVNVVGAVYNPTAIVYSPHRAVKDYIHMAGGTTEIAANKEIYIIKVNGSAVSRRDFHWYGVGRSWDGSDYSFHIGKLGSLTLDPGDTIIVPERLERIAWLREIKDITTIIANVALAAGIAFIALK